MPLITPTEVSQIAFVNALDPALILPEFIASATTKFIVPVVTQSILDSIDATPSDYTILVNDFIKPCLAFAVKYMFYNQLLTETQLFPTSDDQRVAAIQEILSILEIKRDLLKTYLNDNVFESPVTQTKTSVAGIFLGKSNYSASSSDPNADVASTLNAASVSTLSDEDSLNFIQFSTGLLRKLSWTNVKATIRLIFDQIYAPLDHNHGAAILAVSDGIFKLGITTETLSVTPFLSKLSPAPEYPYFRYMDGFPPVAIHELVLEGRLRTSGINASSSTVVPVDALSANASLPAAKFNGGIQSQASNGLPVILAQHFVSGASACNSILLQLTRNISGTISQDKPVININDDPESPNVTGELLKATIDSILRVNLNPRVPNGSSAVAYMFDTRNNLTNTAALLISIRNQGVEKLSLSSNGVLSVPAIKINGAAGVSGTFASSDGKTITVTNGIISAIV